MAGLGKSVTQARAVGRDAGLGDVSGATTDLFSTKLDLPRELWENVFECGQLRDLAACSCVCAKWRRLVTWSSHIWKAVSERRWKWAKRRELVGHFRVYCRRRVLLDQALEKCMSGINTDGMPDLLRDAGADALDYLFKTIQLPAADRDFSFLINGKLTRKERMARRETSHVRGMRERRRQQCTAAIGCLLSLLLPPDRASLGGGAAQRGGGSPQVPPRHSAATINSCSHATDYPAARPLFKGSFEQEFTTGLSKKVWCRSEWHCVVDFNNNISLRQPSGDANSAPRQTESAGVECTVECTVHWRKERQISDPSLEEIVQRHSSRLFAAESMSRKLEADLAAHTELAQRVVDLIGAEAQRTSLSPQLQQSLLETSRNVERLQALVVDEADEAEAEGELVEWLQGLYHGVGVQSASRFKGVFQPGTGAMVLHATGETYGGAVNPPGQSGSLLLFLSSDGRDLQGLFKLSPHGMDGVGMFSLSREMPGLLGSGGDECDESSNHKLAAVKSAVKSEGNVYQVEQADVDKQQVEGGRLGQVGVWRDVTRGGLALPDHRPSAVAGAEGVGAEGGRERRAGEGIQHRDEAAVTRTHERLTGIYRGVGSLLWAHLHDREAAV